MENTRPSHEHPTGHVVIVTHGELLIPQTLRCSRPTSGPSSFQTTPAAQQRGGWLCSVASQTIDTHKPASKTHAHMVHSPKLVHAQRHTHTALHMLKPLPWCLLSHYSIACYFLKQEKAIHPQRSAERFATRSSPGIWEVTLKFEECGEIWRLRHTQDDHL